MQNAPLLAEDRSSSLKPLYPNSRYHCRRYQNALLMEEERELVGVAIFYDGAKAQELDVPLERAAAKKSRDSNYCIPTEAEAPEFYMDVLSFALAFL